MLQSRNYAPPDALSPFVRQFFVVRAPLPPDFVLCDRLISESAMIRVLLGGDWSAKFASDADWHTEGPAILFGPNATSFQARVTGPFMVVGVAIRPSGWMALFETPASDSADTMRPLSATWGGLADRLFSSVDGVDDDLAVVAAIEGVVRDRLAEIGAFSVDPAMAAFEEIARHDSTMRVGEAAARVGLSGRALERHCRATFGMSPKAVLRRSRFLDMAAAVRGISDPDAEERAALRFSDQSHMNREFRHFVGMTPRQFERAQTPLLNAVLKLREDGIS